MGTRRRGKGTYKLWRRLEKGAHEAQMKPKLPKGIVSIGTSQDNGSERHITTYNRNQSVRCLLVLKRGARGAMDAIMQLLHLLQQMA